MSNPPPAPLDDDHVASALAVLLFRRREFAVRPGLTVREAMLQCGVQPDTVLVTRDGELIDDETVLRAGDRVKLLPVSSGG